MEISINCASGTRYFYIKAMFAESDSGYKIPPFTAHITNLLDGESASMKLIIVDGYPQIYYNHPFINTDKLNKSCLKNTKFMTCIAQLPEIYFRFLREGLIRFPYLKYLVLLIYAELHSIYGIEVSYFDFNRDPAIADYDFSKTYLSRSFELIRHSEVYIIGDYLGEIVIYNVQKPLDVFRPNHELINLYKYCILSECPNIFSTHASIIKATSLYTDCAVPFSQDP